MTTPKLLDQVRSVIRMRHYSRRTEDSYVHWIRRFILFHGKRHPSEMGEREITAFLSDLAVSKNVAAATQNQALGYFVSLPESPRHEAGMAGGRGPGQAAKAFTHGAGSR